MNWIGGTAHRAISTSISAGKEKTDTHIMAINFHKHRPISMPFDRIVHATLLDYCP